MAKRKKSRTSREAVVPPPSPPAADEAIALLQNVKLDLQATRAKLMLLQPDTLSDEEHARWSDEISKVNLAISAVRTALLGAISAVFAAQLPAIAEATDKLSDDLFRLQSATDVINAVASALGIIERIAQLLA